MSLGATMDTTHPDLETLMGYQARQLPEEQAEELREHLVDCALCLERFLEIQSFESSLEDPPDPALDTVREAAWTRLESSLAEPPPSALGEAPAPPRPAPPSAPPPPSRRLPWSVAAGLAILSLSTGLGTFRYRGELDRSEARLAASRAEEQRLLAQLEALSSAAEVPPPVFTLAVRPAFRVRNSATEPLLEEGALNRLELGPEADPVEARIELPTDIDAPELLFLLRSEKGQVLGAQVKALRSVLGDLGTSLLLPATEPGGYRIEIVALRTGGGTSVAAYDLELIGPG